MVLSYIVWDVNPEILPSVFENLFVHPRWYGVLFALGFLLGYQLMSRYFKKEGIDLKQLDSLLVYVMVGTVLGARLGHVFFYDWDYYQDHLGEILQVWQGGLASHGAAVGNLTALYLWSRKYKHDYLWTLDRVVITIALAACLIRTGNLMNSEIYGKPTESSYGFVFAEDVTGYLEGSKIVRYADAHKGSHAGEYPVEVELGYDPRVMTVAEGEAYTASLIDALEGRGFKRDNFHGPFKYRVEMQGDDVIAYLEGEGVPRYPTQIYEALGYLLIFLLLYMQFDKRKNTRGWIFGVFLITVFGWRIIMEYFKENQVAFEDAMQFNMGQLLSVPLVIAGLYFIFTSKNRPGNGSN